MSEYPVTAAMVDHYRRHGWVKLEAFFTAAEVEEAIGRVEAFIQSQAGDLRGRDINRVDAEVNSIHRLQIDPWFDALLGSGRMKNLVRPFLDDEPTPRKSELFAKPAVVGLASPPHQDNYLFCVDGGNALTVWVALDPADERNGGLYYHDGSHSGGLVPHEMSFMPGTSQRVRSDVDLTRYPRVTPHLMPGDLLIHHSEIVHGSLPNTSEFRRRGWTLQYKGEAAKYDESRLAQYEAELERQLVARGVVERD